MNRPRVPPSRRTASPAEAPLGYRHSAVQQVRRLLARPSERRAAGRFVVEGPTLLAEALAADVAVEAVYASAEGTGLPIVEECRRRGLPVSVLAPGVLERIGDVVTPQAVLAVVPTVDVALESLHGTDFLLICVDVRDPGNAGTLLRAARAAGVGGVVCCGGTVDVFNPKTVRASAGAIFRVDVVAGGDPVDVLTTVGSWGMQRVGADPRAATSYTDADLTGPLALVVGNEARGLGTADVAGVLDTRVRIPMMGGVDSLNVAMAASVLCFEAARQRQEAPGTSRGGEVPWN